jgi:UDP-N-acetylmuramoylalanine--D-glutamate ligase
MTAYTAAKARILDFQNNTDIAILGCDDAGAWALRNKVKGRLFTFSLHDLDEGLDGAYLHDGLLNLRDGNAYLPLMLREKVLLRGDHNVSNVLAAFTIGHAAGFTLDAMLEAMEDFHGVAHRLEFVRELHGVRWYNDSIATAPERAMAAVRAFDEPIVLMLGGHDKDLPWEDLAVLIHERVDHVVIFGEATEKIEKAVAVQGSMKRTKSVARCSGLHEAVVKAAEVAEVGDVVLLSPGGTSYDEFVDFAERGERFRQWVQELS